MEDVLDKHKQEFDEIRRLCLLCHGLDLTSSTIFGSETYSNPTIETKSILHSLLSSHLLRLAVAIRINLYQESIENITIPVETMVAGYYEDHELIVKPVTIKDICDKIIHADSVTKPIFPKNLLDSDVKISFQLKGTNRKRAWTLNLSLELFAETVLKLLDRIDHVSY
ncbi:hypothetical protein [Onishia taeanensis]|uniref:hypothetical protein n=1 Tax=Onishia taeanensis TaxID=284577 RepID=UPI0011BDB2A6|nr:hypothetical protein [Halomonas taeanensis]